MLDCEVLTGGDRVIDRVRAEAAQPNVERIRLALGYLFVPGLQPIWDALEASSATDIRLLIGNTAGILTDEQRIAADAAAQSRLPHPLVDPEHDMAAGPRADRDSVIRETAQALRENLRQFAQSRENDRFVIRLASAIGANRLHVRIYPDGRLHSKASLFELRTDSSGASASEARSVALVGASNLTLPNVGTSTELNVLLRAPDEVAAIATWFDLLWDRSQDFTRALFLELTQQAAGGDWRMSSS